MCRKKFLENHYEEPFFNVKNLSLWEEPFHCVIKGSSKEPLHCVYEGSSQAPLIGFQVAPLGVPNVYRAEEPHKVLSTTFSDKSVHKQSAAQ